jgi:hypothetical protein
MRCGADVGKQPKSRLRNRAGEPVLLSGEKESGFEMKGALIKVQSIAKTVVLR